MRILIVSATMGLLLAVSAGPASSEQRHERHPELMTDWGMSVSVGGGFTQFLDSSIREFAEPGGGWDFRFTVGTRRSLAFEGAYIGGIYPIDALGLDNDALLMTTGFEGNIRYNFGLAAWQPYVITGIAWKRYDITNADQNTSSVANDDNVAEIPIGAGLGYRHRGLIVDARAVIRPTLDANLIDAAVADRTGGELHNYALTLTVGYEF